MRVLSACGQRHFGPFVQHFHAQRHQFSNSWDLKRKANAHLPKKHGCSVVQPNECLLCFCRKFLIIYSYFSVFIFLKLCLPDRAQVGCQNVPLNHYETKINHKRNKPRVASRFQNVNWRSMEFGNSSQSIDSSLQIVGQRRERWLRVAADMLAEQMSNLVRVHAWRRDSESASCNSLLQLRVAHRMGPGQLK